MIKRNRSLVFLLVTPVLLLLQLLVGVNIYTIIKSINETEATKNKLETYLRINSRYVMRSESSERGYLLTGDPRYLDPFFDAKEELRKNEEIFNSLAAADRTSKLVAIHSISERKMQEIGLTIGLFNAGLKDSALATVESNTGRLAIDSIRDETKVILDQIGADIVGKRQKENQLTLFFFSLLSVLFLFNIFFAIYSYRKTKAYTANLEQLISSLEASNTKMRRYTYMSYHQLKTPLRNISGFLKLLQRKHSGEMDDESNEFVDYITDGVKQIDRIIDEMRKKHLEKEE